MPIPGLQSAQAAGNSPAPAQDEFQRQRQSGRSSGVEHNLAKVGVEGSNPFARSSFPQKINGLENHFPAGGVNFAVFGSCSDFRENVRISGGPFPLDSPELNLVSNSELCPQLPLKSGCPFLFRLNVLIVVEK